MTLEVDPQVPLPAPKSVARGERADRSVHLPMIYPIWLPPITGGKVRLHERYD
jgi:hypothetical protein